jgi:hypothetical protein
MIDVKKLSPDEFLALGVNHIAYIRRVDIDGNQAYAIRSADGKTLGLEPSFDLALGTLRFSDLNDVLVH